MVGCDLKKHHLIKYPSCSKWATTQDFEFECKINIGTIQVLRQQSGGWGQKYYLC